MGKGDKRSFKGKLFMGSFGKSRLHKIKGFEPPPQQQPPQPPIPPDTPPNPNNPKDNDYRTIVQHDAEGSILDNTESYFSPKGELIEQYKLNTSEKKKARIFYNTNNWEKADNTDLYAKPNINNIGYGEIVNNNIAFGFEEWLFNPILLNLKIGFLECYRQYNFLDKVDITLFTRCNFSGWLKVAELKGVEQIKDKEINHYKTELEKNNWQQQCHKDLVEICNNNDTNKQRAKELWDNHWNSSHIVCTRNTPRDGFVVNIKYEEIIDFKLSEFDPNKCWKLSKRYSLENNEPNEVEEKSNPLTTPTPLNNNNLFPNEPHQCYDQDYIILLIRTIINNQQQAHQQLLNRSRNFARYIRTERRGNDTILIVCAGAVHNLYNSGYRGNGTNLRHSINYEVGPGLPACIAAMRNFSTSNTNITFFNYGNDSTNTRLEIILN